MTLSLFGHLHQPRRENGPESEKTHDRCIRIGGAVEFIGMQTTASRAAASEAEIIGYASPAQRGDVLPICMRLSVARSHAEWEARFDLVKGVGPACRPDALATACHLMPNATEPRLLRAARALAVAEATGIEATRQACFASAKKDLADAARIDPMDATVRAMLVDLVGSQAWAAAA